MRKKNSYTSIVEFFDGYVVKTLKNKDKTHFIENEVKFLNLLKGKDHFPQIISSDKFSITMSYCGPNLTKDNMPDDYEEQIEIILEMLEELDIQHNDIKPSELLVLDGKIHVCDFGWSSVIGEPIPDSWPRGLGSKYRPKDHSFDDRYSIYKSIESILND